MLAVGVPEEDGVIHSDSELQDGRESFGEVGDLTKKNVGAEVVENHNTDAD